MIQHTVDKGRDKKYFMFYKNTYIFYVFDDIILKRFPF